MMRTMRTTIFAPNEYYHLFSRGINKNTLFFDDFDRARFLFLLLHFQSPTPLHNIGSYASSYVKKNSFGLGSEKLKEILEERHVELISFCLMPNHLHILIKNIEEYAISVYMQRVLMAYAKYFNKKYKRYGHVFEGPFQAVHIKNNTQLLHTSAYIHRNPIELTTPEIDYRTYPWSSCRDHLDTNRWAKLIIPDIISKQFKTLISYKNFVSTSPAKEHVP